MSSRLHLRWVLAMSLLCSAARPAFADGVFNYDSDKVITFLIEVFAVIALVVVVILLLDRKLVRKLGTGPQDRKAKPAEPAVPPARIVRDRDKS